MAMAADPASTKHPALEWFEQWEAEQRARGDWPRRWPKLTPEEQAERHRAFEELMAIRDEILARRNGEPIDVDALLDELHGREPQ